MKFVPIVHRRTFLASGTLSWPLAASSVLGASNTTRTEQTPREGVADEEVVATRGVDSAQLADSAVTQYAVAATPPDWWTDADEVGGDLEYFDTEADVREWLDLEAVDPERRETVDAFVSKTTFDRSGLFYIASVGPSTAYDTIDVTDADGPKAEMIAKATVVETREAESRSGASLTFPSALMRQPLDTGRPDTVTIRIVDGWGDEHDVQVPLPDR